MILLASFVNFLRYNDYPLLRPEVGLIALALLVLAACVGFVHCTQRSLGQAMLDMLLVFLMVNQNGGGFIYSAAAAAAVLHCIGDAASCLCSAWMRRSRWSAV